jgi:tagatose 6-phosphate kinase
VIIAAGLTPAWQTIMQFHRFVPGEVNRAAEVHHFASGKVLNVAVALSHLGASCKTISPVGGPPREMIDREFSALGLSRHWIVSKATTRSCVTILDRTSGTTTELVENAAPLSIEELDEFTAIFAHDAEHASAIVLTGSLPAGTPTTFYQNVLTGVTCPVILDARGPELLATLDRRPWLVKPNREELATTVQRSLDTDAEVFQATQELIDRGAQRVLVSNGAQPAWLNDGGVRYRVTPPTVDRVVNPIGSGDCLAAGVTFAVSESKPPLDCIAYGMAAAAENVTQLLAGRIDPTRVEERLHRVHVETVV